MKLIAELIFISRTRRAVSLRIVHDLYGHSTLCPYCVCRLSFQEWRVIVRLKNGEKCVDARKLCNG